MKLLPCACARTEAPDSRAGGGAPAMESQLSTLATWVRGSNLTGGSTTG